MMAAIKEEPIHPVLNQTTKKEEIKNDETYSATNPESNKVANENCSYFVHSIKPGRNLLQKSVQENRSQAHKVQFIK